MFELFGHGLGVVLVVLILHQLDPGRRWAIPRVLACALAAGVAADLLKMTVMRCRPYDLPFPFAGSVWETFGQWWPLLSGGSESQSFPSAHTATAVGLAAALIWLYPQGRLLFTVLAVLVGCQRVAVGAHYPSDVLVGAAVGCLVAALLLRIGPLPALVRQLGAAMEAAVSLESADVAGTRRGPRRMAHGVCLPHCPPPHIDANGRHQYSNEDGANKLRNCVCPHCRAGVTQW